jgi:hypothetical protein
VILLFPVPLWLLISVVVIKALGVLGVIASLIIGGIPFGIIYGVRYSLRVADHTPWKGALICALVVGGTPFLVLTLFGLLLDHHH